MKHDLNTFARPRTVSWIRQIALNEFHLVETCEVAALACDETIDAPHRLSTIKQRRRNRSSNKTSRSCHQILPH
jgi:hypothetical protein